MDLEEFVDDYISAWNRGDVNGLLALMHGGVAFYNAFWMESSVGKDAATYIRNRLDEDKYLYQRVGDVIAIDNGVAFRYSAHARTDSAIDGAVFNGVEVLIIRDDKIIAGSDFYADPDRTAIEEVAKLTSRRHGLTKYVKSGQHRTT